MSKRPKSDTDLGIEMLAWEAVNAGEAVKSLYEQTIAFARTKVRMYEDESAKGWKRSLVVRWVSLPLVVLGALCPLVDGTGSLPTLKLASWGYVALALAAGVYSIDRFFGYSSEASRNTVAWLRIRKALAECEFDLVLARSQPDDTKAAATSVERLKKLRVDVEQIIADETGSWIDEFREQLARFEREGVQAKGPKS